MDFLLTPEAAQWGLLGLFLSAFLSATLLPGGSEVVLFALIKLHPEQTTAAFVLATIANTAGGMVTYWMARLLPEPKDTGATSQAHKRLELARHWGAPILILAWAPIIGDALCVAAGWLRLPVLPSTLWMMLGKGARYGAIIAGAGLF
jgi:membrane protein YqaA with SNARE-associated domain